MIKIQNITKNKVFDGDQELLKEEININVEGQSIQLKPSQFINQPLLEVETIEGVSLDEIVNEDGFIIKGSLIRKYCNKDGLDVYYFEKNNLILIFSFGEWQPSRFILNLESVWELN